MYYNKRSCFKIKCERRQNTSMSILSSATISRIEKESSGNLKGFYRVYSRRRCREPRENLIHKPLSYLICLSSVLSFLGQVV